VKPLTIADKEMMIAAIHDEIRRNKDARYDHKLHAILLVAQGMKCPEVARIMGDSVRTIETWVNKFEKHGLSAFEKKTSIWKTFETFRGTKRRSEKGANWNAKRLWY
jgi:transposase